MLRILSFSSGDEMADKENIYNKPDNADLETSTPEGDLCGDEVWCVVICHTGLFNSMSGFTRTSKTSSQPVSALV